MKKETYLDVLLKTLEGQQNHYDIEDKLMPNEGMCLDAISNLFDLATVPAALIQFYTKFESIEFMAPRQMRNFSVNELQRNVKQEYLIVFGSVDEVQLAYDTRSLNAAGEWTIVNGDNEYVITKTLASFYTNKLWAWIKRGKKIWEEEVF